MWGIEILVFTHVKHNKVPLCSQTIICHIFPAGARVLAAGKPGTIAFIRATRFAPGQWFGVILDAPDGRNNGEVLGRRYFNCGQRHGLFVRRERITPIPPMQSDEEQRLVVCGARGCICGGVFQFLHAMWGAVVVVYSYVVAILCVVCSVCVCVCVCVIYYL